MPDPDNTDRVFIKDLTIEMSAGIYDHEKQNLQRVMINIILDVESNAEKTLNSIDDIVSYEEIMNEVKAVALAKHYDLLEELAEEIAALCLHKKQVQKAHIRIEKPDIIMDTESVGIEIMRGK